MNEYKSHKYFIQEHTHTYKLRFMLTVKRKEMVGGVLNSLYCMIHENSFSHYHPPKAHPLLLFKHRFD